jgi:hypothetical protein
MFMLMSSQKGSRFWNSDFDTFRTPSYANAGVPVRVALPP